MWIYLVIAFLLIKIVDVISPITGQVIGIFSIAGIAGYILASFITKRFGVAHKILQKFAWFNLIAGILVPILGIFMASVTFGYAENIQLKNKRKLYLLILVGFILSIMTYILSTLYLPKVNSFFENLTKKDGWTFYKSNNPEKDFDTIFGNNNNLNSTATDHSLEIEKCKAESDNADVFAENERFVKTFNQMVKDGIKFSDEQAKKMFEDNTKSYRNQIYEECLNNIN